MSYEWLRREREHQRQRDLARWEREHRVLAFLRRCPPQLLTLFCFVVLYVAVTVVMWLT